MQIANPFRRIGAIAGCSLAQSKNRAAVGAMLLLAGCVTSPPPKPTKVNTSPYHLSAVELEVIKRDLASDLKDPASAMFGAIAAVRTANGVVMVCGTVNGRNNYGGYTGKKPFTGVLGTNTSGKRVFGLAGIGGTETESLSVMMLCERYGLG